jgi:hypothetical protein
MRHFAHWTQKVPDQTTPQQEQFIAGKMVLRATTASASLSQ